MKVFAATISIIAAVLAVFFLSFDFERGSKDFVKKPNNHLELSIPAKVGKTVSKDLPLANTEEVLKATENLLAVTEWLNREYTLPDGRSFVVYISYWAPNKRDVRFASLHTPDRCWVENGWTNVKEKRRFGDELNTGKGITKPAYYREYFFNAGQEKHFRKVWFWFVVDGEIYDYGKDAFISNPISYLKHAFTDAIIGSPEMYFIRIDSDYPLESLLKDEDFLTILDSLGKLALYKNSDGK